jgi:hypothetical protein
VDLLHDAADFGLFERRSVDVGELSLDRRIAVEAVQLPVLLVNRGLDSIAEQLVPLVMFIHGNVPRLRNGARRLNGVRD